jgi:hypothetical protein
MLEPTTRSIRPILWTPHLLSLDPCLFQLLVPQALNPSLLASPEVRWAPLSFLPDVFTLLLFLINPPLISVSLPWVIIDFIYFYASTIMLTQNLHLTPSTQQAEQASFSREKIPRRASQFFLKINNRQSS